MISSIGKLSIAILTTCLLLQSPLWGQLTVTVNGTTVILVDAECQPPSGSIVNAGASDTATTGNGFGQAVTVRLNNSASSSSNPTVEVGVPPGNTNYGPLGSLIPTGTHYIWVLCPGTGWVLAGKWSQS